MSDDLVPILAGEVEPVDISPREDEQGEDGGKWYVLYDKRQAGNQKQRTAPNSGNKFRYQRLLEGRNRCCCHCQN